MVDYASLNPPYELTRTSSRGGDQAFRGCAQRGRQAGEDDDGHVPLPPLDLRYVGPIEASLESKLFLRQVQGLPRLSHVRGDSAYNRRFVHHGKQIDRSVDFRSTDYESHLPLRIC